MVPLAITDFGAFLAQTGAIAGGATAWGVSLGLIVAAVATDLGYTVDRWANAARGGSVGALFGVSFALAEVL